MANNFLQLALVMGLIDKASSPLRTVARNAEKTGNAADKAANSMKKFEAVSERLTRAAVKIGAYGSAWESFGNSIVDKFRKPIDAYARLETGMVALKTAMMDSGGVVSDKFRELSDLAVDLSNKLPTTAEEMHKVAAAGIAMGMSEDVMLNGGLQGASNFAMAAMGGDFARSMEITNALQKSWKIDAGDLEKSLDLMARAKSVGVNTEDMMSALAKTGLQAQGRGETGFGNFAQMVPYLATILSDGTMSGDVVGTNFSKIMSKALTADTAKLKKDFRIDLNFVKDGKFAGLENMVEQLQKLSTLDASKQAMVIKQLFGDSVELQSIVFKLISEGNTGVKNMEKTMQKFASIQQKVDATNGTLSAKWNAFTGTLDTSLGKLMEPLDGVFKTLTDGLNKAAAAVGDFAKENEFLAEILTGTVFTVGLTIFAVGKLVTTIGAFMFYLGGFAKAWEGLKFGLFAVKYYMVTGVIPALQQFWVSLVTKVVPSIWATIQANAAMFGAAIVIAAGVMAWTRVIQEFMDESSDYGNDLRVLISGLDGLWAVLKKIGGFVVYLATLGNYIPKWASDAEADIDNMAQERQIGRYAEVAQPPEPSMLTQVGGDTYNLNLEVNNNGKDLDPNTIKKVAVETFGELRQKEKRDMQRQYK